MPTEQKRLTIAINKELEQDLAEEKKETFYLHTQSEMIRILLKAGLKAIKEQKSKGKNPTS